MRKHLVDLNRTCLLYLTTQLLTLVCLTTCLVYIEALGLYLINRLLILDFAIDTSQPIRALYVSSLTVKYENSVYFV